MRPPFLFGPLLALAAFLLPGLAAAQIRVEFELPRRLYVVYEPIIATVAVTNLSGQDLLLHDDGGRKWFGFEITTLDGRIIPPTDPDYKLDALQIATGQTVRRQINLTPIYRLGEFGGYKLRATVWMSDLDRFFSSATRQIDITDGKLLWEETVGVPGGGTRVYSLLSHRAARDTRLYVRVEDREQGIVYATAQIGRTLSFSPPEAEIDAQNVLHILQMIAPRTYFYTQVGTDGQLLARETYESAAQNTRPRLTRTPTGVVAVRGGRVALAEQKSGPPAGVPKLSDRPASLPGE